MNKVIIITSWITQALFLVAVISGIPLIFFYHPTHAYESVQKISYLIPNGYFIRKLHYFSSEALLVFVIIHSLEQFFTKEIKITKISWVYGTIASVLIILLLFTGFVLKADQESHSAGLVAISMINNIPVLSILSSLFESSVHYFYWKFLLWHILFLPAAVTILLYYHSGRIDAPLSFVSMSLAISILAIVFLPMPKDIPLNMTVKGYLNGPWFFEGIEKLLDYGISNIVIIILTMFIPFIMLTYYPFTKYKKVVKILFFLWLIFYVSISLV